MYFIFWSFLFVFVFPFPFNYFSGSLLEHVPVGMKKHKPPTGADTGFSEGGGGMMATRGGGGVIGGDRPCRRKITI